ncbi:hypothetical protein GCM10010168_12920 [Actinoplanes ianthinogenes]|uniref:Secreted protein n=1 Tax=Actinoplanes ianthinogenes TaxID=122358 RepID=A0ABN6CJ99_9ACTN|nr:hypothetical protein [Actinoplanes ianthinogenes]BCJ44478.1 hypothetical protein Aiant_51350 [Actinoplanes ianthinogenes]GGQ98207.1 hypothetical protein GCM10010168_12920 [Actinoplanes ianthinogenes]
MDIIAVNNFGDTRDGGLAGPMGLFLIVLMCIATVALIRNMNKRIRRLPDSFDAEAERERVAEIARLNEDLERSGGDAAADVEADRSAKPDSAAESEVAAVAEDKSESASDSGRTAR